MSKMCWNPDSSVEFARGSSLQEGADDGGGSMLSTNRHMVVDQDLHIKGSLTSDTADLNLGVPLVASEDLSRGDVLSLASTGGITKGFGMQLSAPVASFGRAGGKLVPVQHSDTVVSVLRTNATGSLWAVYYDTASTVAEAAVLVSDTPVLDFTAAAMTPSTFLACYSRQVDAEVHGFCRAAVRSDGWVFGPEAAVTTAGTYLSGALTNLVGVDDRAVLAYSVSNSGDRFNAQLISVTANVATLGGILPLNIESQQAAHISAAALSDTRILIAYLAAQDGTTRVRELFFNPGDLLTVQRGGAKDLALTGVTLYTHTSVARLDDARAVVAFRSPSEGNTLYAAVVDAPADAALTVGTFTLVDSGVTPPTDAALHVSTTGPRGDRLGIAFLDSDLTPKFIDGGVFGTSVVVGRAQKVQESAAASATAAVDLGPGQALVLEQGADGGLSTTGYRATLFGGPTMLGFAKEGATSGNLVTVVLQGAMDAFSGLTPGAPYYARYDGGIGVAPDAANGVSSTVVGKAVTPTTLVASFDSDSAEIATDIDALATTIGGLTAQADAFSTCVNPLYDGIQNTTFTNSSLPVFRWAVWSTYSNGAGWHWGNSDRFQGGVHPSHWSDSSYRAYNMQNSKKVWATLFNKKMYGSTGPNTMVHGDEWYYTTSTNSRHVGVLFRINNTTPSTIQWRLRWIYTAYGSWSESASITINGEGTWQTTSNTYNAFRDQTLNVPANRISTVIIVSGSAHPSTTRPLQLAFMDNTLDLPDGLEYVDDLHWNTEGGWES